MYTGVRAKPQEGEQRRTILTRVGGNLQWRRHCRWGWLWWWKTCARLRARVAGSTVLMLISIRNGNAHRRVRFVRRQRCVQFTLRGLQLWIMTNTIPWFHSRNLCMPKSVNIFNHKIFQHVLLTPNYRSTLAECVWNHPSQSYIVSRPNTPQECILNIEYHIFPHACTAIES